MNCPFCGKPNNNVMRITFIEKIDWMRCSCGCVYQIDKQECDLHGEDYLTTYRQKKFYDKSAQYPARVYLPLIEEITYGRKLLEIDSIDLEFTKEAQKRGWVAWTTGENETEHATPAKSFFKDTEFPDGFDLIYSYHSLEKSDNQAEYLKKCYKTLNGGGCLLIATPNTDCIDTYGVPEYGHFYKENKLMFNLRKLVEELKRFRFDVILARENTSPRFLKTNDIHIIAQKG